MAKTHVNSDKVLGVVIPSVILIGLVSGCYMLGLMDYLLLVVGSAALAVFLILFCSLGVRNSRKTRESQEGILAFACYLVTSLLIYTILYFTLPGFRTFLFWEVWICQLLCWMWIWHYAVVPLGPRRPRGEKITISVTTHVLMGGILWVCLPMWLQTFPS